MKKFIQHTAISTLLAICVPLQTSNAQNFANLSFESANLTPVQGFNSYPGLVPESSALPDWTAYIGGVEQTQVGQNTYALSVATVDILGPNWGTQPGPLGGTIGIIGGEYTVLLQGGVSPTDASVPANASIAQTGTVPSTAQSLTFRAWEVYPSLRNTFSVSFSGNTLTPILLSAGTAASGQQHNVYGVAIKPYAGQTGQLEFTSNYGGRVVPSLLLDRYKVLNVGRAGAKPRDSGQRGGFAFRHSPLPPLPAKIAVTWLSAALRIRHTRDFSATVALNGAILANFSATVALDAPPIRD